MLISWGCNLSFSFLMDQSQALPTFATIHTAFNSFQVLTKKRFDFFSSFSFIILIIQFGCCLSFSHIQKFSPCRHLLTFSPCLLLCSRLSLRYLLLLQQTTTTNIWRGGDKYKNLCHFEGEMEDTFFQVFSV